MSTPRISVRGLTKKYKNVDAVSDLSFEVTEGSVCGLLGPNGSGKTTTFKCLLGHAHPAAGAILFDGKALEPALFERLAYVPETPALYEWMSAGDHFEAARRAYRAYDVPRERQLIDLFSIDRKMRVRALSKGQKTAVAIAVAFAMRPEIMVLDEPASGLDPVHQRSVLNLIIEAAAGGATILFSSHQIGQVERAADCIVIVQRGRLVLGGSVDDLKADQKVIEATFEREIPALDGINTDPSVSDVMRVGRTVRLTVKGNHDAIALRLQSFGPTSLRVYDQNLEDIFLNAVGAKPLGVAIEANDYA